MVSTIVAAGGPEQLPELAEVAIENPPKGMSRKRSSHGLPPWRFAAPALVIFSTFVLLPTLLNFGFPFTNWSSYKSEIDFTGLKTFSALAEDGTLVSALRITLVFAFLGALFSNVFGLGLALLLEQDNRANRIVRTAFFIPVLMSALAVGYIFRALLTPDGSVNTAIGAVLGRDVAIPWLSDPTWTIVVIALIHGWKWMGLSMLIYLAGLKTIPHDMLEAARIDGASSGQSFRFVRWPMLAPAVTFNVAASLIGSLNSFDIILATTNGGPASSTAVLPIYIFNVFGQGLYAQAAAMNLLLFLVASALAIPLIVFLRRRERAL